MSVDPYVPELGFLLPFWLNYYSVSEGASFRVADFTCHSGRLLFCGSKASYAQNSNLTRMAIDIHNSDIGTCRHQNFVDTVKLLRTRSSVEQKHSLKSGNATERR
jgi:hypothetical protein